MSSNLPFSVPVFLAPMSGVTDLPFRRIVKRYGAGMVFSEMIASRMMVDEMRHEQRHKTHYHDEFPLAAQIAGCDPDIMAEAAQLNEARGAAMIDINFGCPVKKVVNAMAGSALMRDVPLATRIMQAVVSAVKIPVSVKMRLGWDDDNINAPDLARIAEDTGIKMVTVHGRTRCQLYSGTANWHAVRTVKDTVTIPVIINGDIQTTNDAKMARAQSGADGVMVGRGANGKPWALRQIIDNSPTPSLDEVKSVMIEHYDSLLSHYGIEQGMKIARKHIGWYLQNWDEQDTIYVRNEIYTAQNPNLAITCLSSLPAA
jgi:tRNA-dihydrouridine synthase B